MPGPRPPMDHYLDLQHAIREVISRPDFDAALPPLSDKTWMKILAQTQRVVEENDRLEFLGDALMYATIGRQLYAQIPDGNPHLYTSVRAALHSNMTFAMLAEKLDILAVSDSVLRALTRNTFGESTAAPAKSKSQVKATADLFETVIGAYYLDHGFEALYAWVKEIYTPLIAATTQTFYACRRGNRPPRPAAYMAPMRYEIRSRRGPPPPSPARRLLLSPVPQRKRALEKIKAAHVARRSPSAKLRIIGRPIVNAQPKLLAPKLSQASSSKAVIQVAPAKKAAPIFVDLTLSDDEEGEIVVDRPLRHPMVTPRIPRRTPASVSKRPTPVPAAIPAADRGSDSHSDSESEDDNTLQSMLMEMPSSDSDMDCSSDGVESPKHHSNLAPLLTRTGYRGAFDFSTQQPVTPWRGVIFK